VGDIGWDILKSLNQGFLEQIPAYIYDLAVIANDFATTIHN